MRSQAVRSPMIVAGLLCLAGCMPRTGNSPPITPSNTVMHPSADGANPSPEDAIWPFWPASMRLHPLTRVITDEQTGRLIIESRVEFADADGETSKAIGQLTLQAYPDALTPAGAGALETWNQDLRDLTVNRRQYDDVTRTYLFRLQTNVALPPGAVLRAYFLSADGKRFNADMRLRR